MQSGFLCSSFSPQNWTSVFLEESVSWTDLRQRTDLNLESLTVSSLLRLLHLIMNIHTDNSFHLLKKLLCIMRLEKTGAYDEAVRSILRCFPTSSPREIHEGHPPPLCFPNQGWSLSTQFFSYWVFPHQFTLFIENYPAERIMSFLSSVLLNLSNLKVYGVHLLEFSSQHILKVGEVEKHHFTQFLSNGFFLGGGAPQRASLDSDKTLCHGTLLLCSSRA